MRATESQVRQGEQGAPSRRGRGPLLIGAAGFSIGGALVLLTVAVAQLQASLAYGLLVAAAALAQRLAAAGVPVRLVLVNADFLTTNLIAP
jgi:hypothetical protein